MRRRALIDSAASIILLVFVPQIQAEYVAASWITVRSIDEVAEGTIGPVSVTISGGNIVGGITDGGFTQFSLPFFTPTFASSDAIFLLGTNPPARVTYTVTFDQPVTNPRLHIASLASDLIFSTPVTRVSGQSTFAVVANTVTGAFLDGPSPNDANGTVDLIGTYSSFTFSAKAIRTFTGLGDGIVFQIAVDLDLSTCAACPADYNQDGGVDGADLSAFFADYEAGEVECADTNFDGGIDGGDLSTFFAAYESGGC